ncbi:MAG: hypothetical protein ABII18_00300 [bacterium]|nr:soluble NSF attachment family protein [bacterium]MBU1916556.1 soluble NSF attachment family protein [bacterium]
MGTFTFNSLTPHWTLLSLTTGQTWSNCAAIADMNGELVMHETAGRPIIEIPAYLKPKAQELLRPADATIMGRHMLGRTWDALLDAAQVIPNNLVTDVGEFNSPFPVEDVALYMIEVEKQVVVRDPIEEDPTVFTMVGEAEHFLCLLETAETEYNSLSGFKRFLQVKEYVTARQKIKEEALAHLAELHAYCEAMGNGVGIAHTRYLFGKLYDTLGLYNEAIDCYQMALEEAHKSAYLQLESELEFCLAAAFRIIGEPQQMLSHLNRGFSIPDTPHEARVQAQQLYEEAEAMSDHPNKWTVAIEYYEQAADLYYNYARKQRTGDGRALTEDVRRAITCNTRAAYLYLEHENLEEARDYFERALHDSEMIDACETQYDILEELYKVCWKLGEYWDAIDYFNDATEIMAVIDPDEVPNRRAKLARLQEYAASM